MTGNRNLSPDQFKRKHVKQPLPEKSIKKLTAFRPLI